MRQQIIGGWSDFSASIKVYYIWLALGWVEIRQRYSRSKIGPFWLTISMGIMIGALGLVYATLFKTDIRSYLPFLAIGLVFWVFISTTINEGCTAFISSSAYIRQMALPRGVFVLQTIWRNSVILTHNFVIVIIVLVVFHTSSLYYLPSFIFGLFLLTINLLWITTLLAIMCARFRDLPQIVASGLQVAFYITPVIFKREMLDKYPLLVDLNPFAYLVEIVRAPLLGQSVSDRTWIVCGLMALIGLILGLIFHGRYRTRIAYWV